MVVRGEHGLGHESAGIVLKLGPGVTAFKEGCSSALAGDNCEATEWQLSLESPALNQNVITAGLVDTMHVPTSSFIPHHRTPEH